MYIRTKELPPILRHVLKQVGYNCPDVEVEVAEEVQPFYPAGQGSRAFVIPVNLLTQQYEIRSGSWGGSNMFTPPAVPDDSRAPAVLIPPNGAIVIGSSGHWATARIYISPQTAAPLLPEAPKLTKEELVALYCHEALKCGEPRRVCLRNY